MGGFSLRRFDLSLTFWGCTRMVFLDFPVHLNRLHQQKGVTNMIRIFLVWTGALGIGITFGVIAGLLLKFLREYLPATRVGLLVGGVAWVAAAHAHLSGIGPEWAWAFAYGSFWVFALLMMGACIVWALADESRPKENHPRTTVWSVQARE